MNASKSGPTAADLASEIHRLEAWPEALMRRVKGVAWMIWGLILVGAFFTYDFLGLVHLVYGGGMWPFAVIWIPWVGLGVLATWAVWKANGLRTRGEGAARKIAITFVTFAALVFLFFVGYHYSGVWRHSPLVGPSVMLTMVGLAAIVIGVVGLGCSDRTDKMLWLVGGAALLLVVTAGTLWAGNDAQLALRLFGFLGPLATALVYFGNGLYLTLRG